MVLPEDLNLGDVVFWKSREWTCCGTVDAVYRDRVKIVFPSAIGATTAVLFPPVVYLRTAELFRTKEGA